MAIFRKSIMIWITIFLGCLVKEKLCQMDHGTTGGMNHGMGHVTHGVDHNMGTGMNNNMDHVTHDMNHDMGTGMHHDRDDVTHGMDHVSHNMDHGDGHSGEHDEHEDDHEDDHDMGGGHHGGGSAYFYVGNTVQLIFKEWETDSDRSIALSTFYVVLVAIFYEGLKALRDYLMVRSARLKVEQREWSYRMKSSKSDSKCTSGRACLHLILTLIYMIQIFVSMCLMLVFMTFNAWLCGAVVVGGGIGYLFFGMLRHNPDIDEDSCH